MAATPQTPEISSLRIEIPEEQLAELRRRIEATRWPSRELVGGRAEDAFHLVLPPLPGYGLSGEPAELGWENGRIAPGPS